MNDHEAPQTGDFSILGNAAFCVAPFLAVPVAFATVTLGPCGGIHGFLSGILLLLTAVCGISSVLNGFNRWARTADSGVLRKLVKIGTCLAGVVAILANGYFVMLSATGVFFRLTSGY